MSRLDQIRSQTRPSWIFEGQAQHLGILFFMLAGVYHLLPDPTDAHRVLLLTPRGWALTSVWLAIAHQVVVAIGFRAELHLRLLTRFFGDNALWSWAVIFLPLLVLRPLTVLATGLSDIGSLGLWRPGEIVIGAALLVPAGYALYSTFRYFTLERALGGDHFHDEIADMPMETRGAFGWTQNAMYGLAFLGLWAIALLCGSWAALVVAAFQHAYIWVHMYTVEGPDMRRIYGVEDAAAED
jgi:hypothetical protein